jgi:hypothetical protein
MKNAGMSGAASGVNSGVLVMRDKGYEESDKGTAHYQQCQPEARSVQGCFDMQH